MTETLKATVYFANRSAVIPVSILGFTNGKWLEADAEERNEAIWKYFADNGWIPDWGWTDEKWDR